MTTIARARVALPVDVTTQPLDGQEAAAVGYELAAYARVRQHLSLYLA